MNKKKIIASLLIAISMFGLISCEEPSVNTQVKVNTPTEDKKEDINFNEIINKADKIKVKENIFNLNRVYEVLVDGSTIGRIDGKFANITGDVFTLTDTNDNIIASEKQIKRWGVKLNRLAEVYDDNGNVSGYIGEEVINDLFHLGRVMHFYDKDKNEIGTCEQKVFNYLDEYVVYDNEGNEDYRIKEQLTFMEPEYIIEVKDKESIIKRSDTVFVTSIIDSIKQAEEKKEQDKKKKEK